MKKDMRDVKIPKNGERTIRNIPIPGKHNSDIQEELVEKEDSSTPVNFRKIPDTKKFESFSIGDRKKRNWPIWVIAVLSVLFVWLTVSAFFEKGTITFVTENIPIDVVGEITASKNGDALTYAVLTLEGTKETSVKGTGKKEISEKATGKIIIYNNTTEIQKLVVNTRFETPEGLIYRIDKAVTVPAKTTKEGKATPGSIEATIVADKPGKEYNIALADFTIPGFKGTDKFDQVYARSKTAPSGGGLGTVAEVSKEDIAKTSETLKNDLEKELIGKVKAEIPSNFVIPDGAWISSVNTSVANLDQEGATIRAEGTVKAYAINIQSLYSEFSAKDKTVKEGENIKTVSSTLVAKTFGESDDTLTAELSGTLTITADIDKQKVAQISSGKTKIEIAEYYKSMAGVESISVSATPFWVDKIPTNIENIKVVVK